MIRRISYEVPDSEIETNWSGDKLSGLDGSDFRNEVLGRDSRDGWDIPNTPNTPMTWVGKGSPRYNLSTIKDWGNEYLLFATNGNVHTLCLGPCPSVEGIVNPIPYSLDYFKGIGGTEAIDGRFSFFNENDWGKALQMARRCWAFVKNGLHSGQVRYDIDRDAIRSFDQVVPNIVLKVLASDPYRVFTSAPKLVIPHINVDRKWLSKWNLGRCCHWNWKELSQFMIWYMTYWRDELLLPIALGTESNVYRVTNDILDGNISIWYPIYMSLKKNNGLMNCITKDGLINASSSDWNYDTNSCQSFADTSAVGRMTNDALFIAATNILSQLTDNRISMNDRDRKNFASSQVVTSSDYYPKELDRDEPFIQEAIRNQNNQDSISVGKVVLVTASVGLGLYLITR